MDKNVKKIRKSIEQRKKMRGLTPKEESVKHVSVLPQEEEKHGYYPVFTETPPSTGERSKLVSSMMFKGILSVMLFFGTALLLETDRPLLSGVQEWTSGALTEEFPFARVNLWYQETFGSPLAFTSEDHGNPDEMEEGLALPVLGHVQETFQTNGRGITIAPEGDSDVSALRDGVVLFAGNDRETEKTVTVQHADGSKTTYGNLSEIDVHLYQFVTTNQRIGTFTPTAGNETVYFSIENEDGYIDPVQVIEVDDHP